MHSMLTSYYRKLLRRDGNPPPPGDSSFWTPDDFAAHLPDTPLISSRHTVASEDFLVERRRQAPQELAAGPMTHHLLGLVLGPPAFHFWRDIAGDVKHGLRVPGATTVIPAGRPRRARWDDTADLLHIYMSPEFLERVAEPFMPNPDRIEILPEFSAIDPQIDHIGRALLADLEEESPGSRLFEEGMMTALGVHLLRHYVAFPAQIPGILSGMTRTELRRALEYLHDNLESDLSLKEIAAYAGLSANYLTTLFKRTTGDSLHQYVIRARVERAISLVRRTDLSITEIAQQVGFYDSSHLTRHFKRLTGVTPRSLRRTSEERPNTS
jgi:AraC family transcriptional regulator